MENTIRQINHLQTKVAEMNILPRQDWVLIDLKESIQNENNLNLADLLNYEDQDDALKQEYLNSMQTPKFGSNTHVRFSVESENKRREMFKNQQL